MTLRRALHPKHDHPWVDVNMTPTYKQGCEDAETLEMGVIMKAEGMSLFSRTMASHEHDEKSASKKVRCLRQKAVV